MAFKKIMRGVPSDPLPAQGLLYHDYDAITPCQRECIRRLCISIQMEQESYITQHPELLALVEMFIAKMTLQGKRRCDFIKEAADFFLRDVSDIDREIRETLGIGPEGPYTQGKINPFVFENMDLVKDLMAIISKHYPPDHEQSGTSSKSTPNTMSSSFISIQTSATTLPTPEPIKTPEPTFDEIMYSWISNLVDKAIFSKVMDRDILYDTAYVQLIEAVERAMEIPVTEIRQDIAALFLTAWTNFEEDIIYKEKLAAEIAWEKRMRKKMKRSLRRQNNFKGYETPPTPKSTISTHESYKVPPPKPCKCHPQFHYNRYEKDRFGIYLPRDEQFEAKNVTVTPEFSLEDLDENDTSKPKEEGQDNTEGDATRKASGTSIKTNTSKKSRQSRRSAKSAASAKTAVTIKSVTSIRSFVSSKSAIPGSDGTTNTAGGSESSAPKTISIKTA